MSASTVAAAVAAVVSHYDLTSFLKEFAADLYSGDEFYDFQLFP